MQVSDLSGNEIVCTSELSQALVDVVPGLAILHSDDKVAIVSIGDQIDSVSAYLAENGQNLSPRFMDRFFIQLSEDDKLRQLVLTGFFNVVAPLYRELVDVARNLENIETLLTIVQDQITLRTDVPIVDLGCGIGLSNDVAHRRGFKIAGTDPCPNMRHLARLNGLTAWSPGVIARLPPNTLQAAFASYVFHLIPESGLLRLTWHRIESGGIIVANFHKQQGIEQFKATMQTLDGIPIALDAALSFTRHGQYLAYKKL